MHRVQICYCLAKSGDDRDLNEFELDTKWKRNNLLLQDICVLSLSLRNVFFFFENVSYPVWVLIDARNVIKLELSFRRPLNWKFPVLQLLRLPTVWLIEIVQMFSICPCVRPPVLTMCFYPKPFLHDVILNHIIESCTISTFSSKNSTSPMGSQNWPPRCLDCSDL